MRVIKITPSKLSGSIRPPSYKSLAHRAIIGALLARDRMNINNIYYSDDIYATINAAKAFGASIYQRNSSILLTSTSAFLDKNIEINANESASTLRFLIPIVAALGINCRFVGRESLSRRPIAPILHCMEGKGVTFSDYQGLPLSIRGKLLPGRFSIEGNISSQFISGLLFALPLLDGDSDIVITSHIESYQYIQMTLDVLKQFQISIQKKPYGFSIKGNQQYKACSFLVEPDWSQAANFIVAAALGSKIRVRGLNLGSVQGDQAILNILDSFGYSIKLSNGTVQVLPGKIKAVDVDVSQCPDLLPILAVIASFANGNVFLYGANRLRFKESDRLKATANALNSIGADITELNDALLVRPVPFFKGGVAESYGDHRIVMALTMCAARSKEPIFISNYLGVNKSYPTFFDDFRRIGGKADVVDFWK